MKIGYPCINNTLKCTANRTFRLSNYSEENLIKKVEQNLECLKKTLTFNVDNNLLFFRIGSGLIPFASHKVCLFNWGDYFGKELKEIGKYIKEKNIRISMHPDQFVVLNALNEDILERSIKEIEYHCKVLDFMGLEEDAKVQIHIGGVYGEKEKSKERFVRNYLNLSPQIKKRLVVENDHNSYSLKDCLEVNKKTEIPIVFDTYHHQCLNNGESFKEAFLKVKKVWKEKDGVPMIDYSEQEEGKRKGVHAQTLTVSTFENFLKEMKEFDFDIMFEIKDKEKSALKAVKVL
jgi:UV DNA damage endonuclease